MNDDTRNEIVRLARKGWSADQIVNWTACTEEQVQRVIDEAQDERRDEVGRIAKWLDEAREMGYESRDIARMLGEVYVGPAPGRAAGSVEELADLLDEMADGEEEQVVQPTVDQLVKRAGKLFNQAFAVAKQAKELIAPTPEEMDEAVRMVNDMYSDVSEDRPDLGTADGLWDVLEQIMEARREAAEAKEGHGA